MIERRDSERLLLKIPIRVTSFGGSAGNFTEETYTVEINRKGARITLQHRVEPEATLRIVNLENLREADFQVVGPIRLEGGELGDWGVECLETNRNIWDMEFAAPLSTVGQQAGALIECKDCGTQSFCSLQDWEIDALDSGSMQRLCQKCGGPTDWRYVDVNRRAAEPRPAEAVAAAPAPLVVPAPLATPPRVERRVRRLALKLPILVRDKTGDQEVSKTENVSKGGVAVALGMELELGDIVTVCCPYSEGGQNVEQKAEVRHREVFFIGQRWIYGMRFI